MKKKWLVGTAGALVLLGTVTTAAFAGNPIKFLVNGTYLNPEVPGQIIQNRAFVPIRFVADALGATVQWDAATKTVVIHSNTAAKDDQIQMFEQMLTAKTAQDAVKTWAAGVKGRNGAEQFAVMSSTLRSQMRGDFEATHWVTGSSSPWVDDFYVSDTKQVSDTQVEFDVRFLHRSSTGYDGISSMIVQVMKEGDKWVVSKITPHEGIVIPYATVRLSDGTAMITTGQAVQWKDVNVTLGLQLAPKDLTDNKALVQTVVGNHAEVLSTETVKLPAGDAILATVKRTPPAADPTGQTTTEYWLIKKGGQDPQNENAVDIYTVQATVTGDEAKAKNQVLEIGQAWTIHDGK